MPLRSAHGQPRRRWRDCRAVRIITLVTVAALPPIFSAHLHWWVSGLFVLLGLVIYGLPDWRRFSLKRSWAISGVVFAESIRRRVLLIILVAIPGIIVVSQLQNPMDEQDAIRQTTKVCLFASGIVVVMTSIILACTNLPREIESHVIFTVVTKPTTRLEIVLGKIIGFGRVSATVLILMGLFSYGYLHLRAHRLLAAVQDTLDHGNVDLNKRASLEFYKMSGLLAARQYSAAMDLQIYSRLPKVGDDTRYMRGSDGSFAVRFLVDPQKLLVPGTTDQVTNIDVEVTLGRKALKNHVPAANDRSSAATATTLPWLIQNPDATPDQITVNGAKPPSVPGISVLILDPTMHTLVENQHISGGKPVPIADPDGNLPTIVPVAADGVQRIVGDLDVPGKRLFYVQVSGTTGDDEYFVGVKPVVLRLSDGTRIDPYVDPRGTMFRPQFFGRNSSAGMQLKGESNDPPVAVYRFRPESNASSAKAVNFELEVPIERDDEDTTEERRTKLELTIRDRATNQLSPPVFAYPDSRRTTYFSMPASSIPNKDFDLIVKCLTAGHYVSLTPRSMSIVTENQSFFLNLAKSLLVLWLLTLLVVIVSVFASTFVSWPIAIVLTIFILLGHWGVEQLGDSLAPGLGNSIATDLGLRRADVARTVSRSVDALTKLLNTISSILPNISQFSAIEDLEGSAAVPWSRITDSLKVLTMFGTPMTVLAYIFLRRKEVAP